MEIIKNRLEQIGLGTNENAKMVLKLFNIFKDITIVKKDDELLFSFKHDSKRLQIDVYNVTFLNRDKINNIQSRMGTDFYDLIYAFKEETLSVLLWPVLTDKGLRAIKTWKPKGTRRELGDWPVRNGDPEEVVLLFKRIAMDVINQSRIEPNIRTNSNILNNRRNHCSYGLYFTNMDRVSYSFLHYLESRYKGYLQKYELASNPNDNAMSVAINTQRLSFFICVEKKNPDIEFVQTNKTPVSPSVSSSIKKPFVSGSANAPERVYTNDRNPINRKRGRDEIVDLSEEEEEGQVKEEEEEEEEGEDSEKRETTSTNNSISNARNEEHQKDDRANRKKVKRNGVFGFILDRVFSFF